MSCFEVNVLVQREDHRPAARRQTYRVEIPTPGPEALAAGLAMQEAERSEPWADLRLVSVRPIR